MPALLLGAWCITLACASSLPALMSEEAGLATAQVREAGAAGQDPSAAFYHSFACRLFRTAGATGGNLLLSPHSISTSLALARTGAAGETARQIDALLALPAEAPKVFASIARALTYSPPRPIDFPKETPPEGAASSLTLPFISPVLRDIPGDYSVTLANGVFGQRGSGFLEAFRRSVTEGFGAALIEVDFSGADDARPVINRWVEEKTNGRITACLPPGLPTPETRMVLAGAIHFKASWEDAFPPEDTVDGPFHVARGRAVTAKRMRLTEDLIYGVTREARLVEMRYFDGDTSMLVVLPKARYGLDNLVRDLTPEKIRGWTAGMQTRKIALEFPKFAFTSSLDLSGLLTEMGMADSFLPDRANFSGISTGEKLFIGALLHQGSVAVDENGTEAAAAALQLFMLSGGVREKPVPFVVDHPFLFLIRHQETGAILFMGRVADPTAGQGSGEPPAQSER